MLIQRSIKFDSNYDGQLEEPSYCPLCKHAIQPKELHLSTFKNEKQRWFISIMYLCKHCYQTFIVLHKCQLTNTNSFTQRSQYSAEIMYIEPNRFTPQTFDSHIHDVSPDFVNIYNQALAAENSRLNEIAGVGYRKSLEFLIKDYLILPFPK